MRSNRDWWPNQLNLRVLHQHSPLSEPMGEDFDYAEEFKSSTSTALKADLRALMTDSRRTGGRPTSATTARSSSAWPGTAPAPTASATAAAAPAPASSASRR